MGPSRTDWTSEKLAAGQAALNRMPASARLTDTLLPPIEQNDPSEASRSAEIPGMLPEHFEVIAWRPYGGQLVDLVMPLMREGWSHSIEGSIFVESLLRQEDGELETDSERTHHLVAFLRRKTDRG